MIRCIAAIDRKQGIANEHGIPWNGKVPGDLQYYHAKVKDGIKLMGYGVYAELSRPIPDGINYVASTKDEPLREGFQLVRDVRQFLQSAEGDVWNLGGALLFASTIDLADELYITQLDADFHCTKFFPKFKDDFILTSETDSITENGVTYSFQVWQRSNS